MEKSSVELNKNVVEMRTRVREKCHVWLTINAIPLQKEKLKKWKRK